MKLGQRSECLVNVEEVFFPRHPVEQSFTLKLGAILDVEPFREKVPAPEPPKFQYPGDRPSEPDLNDPEYKKQVSHYNELRTHWMVIESLKATPDLQWDKVDYDKPSTWHHYREEPQAFGLSEFELTKVLAAMMRVNGLDEKYIEEARKLFIASQVKPVAA